MSRAVPEWVAAHDGAAIPPRVKLRVLERHGAACAECGRAFTPKDPPEFDHARALILGGEHREGNLRPLCRPCHDLKTGLDVAAKAKIASVRKKHLGLAPRSRSPLPGGKDSPWKRTIGGRTVRRGDE